MKYRILEKDNLYRVQYKYKFDIFWRNLNGPTASYYIYDSYKEADDKFFECFIKKDKWRAVITREVKDEFII